MTREHTLLTTALSMTHGINACMVRRLDELGITPDNFFSLSASQLCEALQLTQLHRIDDHHRDEARIKARKQLELLEKHSIKALFMLDSNYPDYLREIPDAPVIIYQLGDTDLNTGHLLSMVGTRRPTAYGMNFCKNFTTELYSLLPDLNIVSGLAFGIDSAGHNAALECGATTTAVVAHGLQMIYPSSHRDLALRIIRNGGSILSEYPLGERPNRQRFLERNRIVAGLTPATFVIESDIKGGAMSTARIAFGYNREVLALPGRASDAMSSGSNLLIKRQSAHLVTSVADAITAIGWKPLDADVTPRQNVLFPELEEEASAICDILRNADAPMQIDTIQAASGLPMARVMSIISELEFEDIVCRLPGARIALS